MLQAERVDEYAHTSFKFHSSITLTMITSSTHLVSFNRVEFH